MGLNILTFIQHWVKNHYEHDFEVNPELSSATKKFLKTVQEGEAVSSVILGKFDITAKRTTLSRSKPKGIKRMDAQEHIFDNDSPTSWTPKSSGIKKFTDIPPLELARQFTLLDHFLFSSIQPKECLKCAWSKKEKRN